MIPSSEEQPREHPMIVSIPVSSQTAFEMTVSKINKRAQKLSIPGITFQYSNETIIKKFDGRSYEFRNAIVSGGIEGIKIDGWKIIAAITHTEAGNVVANFSGSLIPTEFFGDTTKRCDHCSTKHVRKQSVLIKNASGDIKQVGKACLEDYIGFDGNTVFSFAKIIKELHDFEEDSIKGSSVDYGENLLEVITVALKLIKNNGFIKTADEDGMSGKISTKTFMGFHFYGNGSQREWIQEIFNRGNISDEAAIETSKNIVEWIEKDESSSEFMMNLKNIVKLQLVSHKFFGYIAGAVASYLKSQEQRDKTETNNEYLSGNVKDKVTLQVTLKNVTISNGFYGMSYIHTFKTADGKTVIWFSTSKSLEDHKGQSMEIIGTIKGFQEFKGLKQTIVTRVKANPI